MILVEKLASSAEGNEDTGYTDILSTDSQSVSHPLRWWKALYKGKHTQWNDNMLPLNFNRPRSRSLSSTSDNTKSGEG